MSPSNLTSEGSMAKAEEFCSAARSALESGKINVAASNAYYAMFHAARAALLASGAPINLEQIRTHPGLIGAFGEHLVKKGHASKEMGRLLNEAKDVRLVADYAGKSVKPLEANRMVEEAETFVAAMRAQFMPDTNDDEDNGPR